MKYAIIALAASMLVLAGCGGKSVLPAGNFGGSQPSAMGHGLHPSIATAITELPVPQPSSGPTGVTTGPDGNIWFTEYFRNSIGVIDVTTHKIKHFHIATTLARPVQIATGPDGNLWFTESIGNKIGKITPAGVITDFALNIPKSDPIGIVSGPGGLLWFTELDANRLASISPTTGAITGYAIPTAHSHPGYITVGSDGALWFTENTANKIGRFFLHGFNEYVLPAGSKPEGIATGPDGNVWFTEAGPSMIGRITPQGVITTFNTTSPNAGPARINAGPTSGGSALWFSEPTVNKIAQITTSGAVTEFSVPTSASGVNGIAAGPDGNIWFAEKNVNQIGFETP
jgi:streptogramin lyase